MFESSAKTFRTVSELGRRQPVAVQPQVTQPPQTTHSYIITASLGVLTYEIGRSPMRILVNGSGS